MKCTGQHVVGWTGRTGQTNRQGDGRLSDKHRWSKQDTPLCFHTHTHTHTHLSSHSYSSLSRTPTSPHIQLERHTDCRPMQMAAVLHRRPLSSARLQMEIKAGHGGLSGAGQRVSESLQTTSFSAQRNGWTLLLRDACNGGARQKSLF